MGELDPREARRLFEAALEQPRSERAGFIDREAAESPGMRSRLHELLRAHDEAAEFLASALDAADDGGADPVESPRSPQGIDRYRLIEVLGEGGMGEVWLAEQDEPVSRQVAVKIIKAGMDTREVIARFEAERQALALMEHPHIARVLDGGTTRAGRPFFVMELVKGVPITTFCDDAGLSIRERLELFSRVCAAVQHAHLKGVIHRDLKPSNVLVTVQDGVPVPKVIDFGIAKATCQPLTEKTLLTLERQLLGTPEYMSPEQAVIGGVDVDSRTDVYSLGVLLYELLTGSRPFRLGDDPSSTFDELLRSIRQVDPERPSSRVHPLGREMQGDLDWIVLRALEKDRERRYETASALAADLERYLGDAPVLATPPSAAYRIRKYARRHRVGVIACSLVAVAVLVALAALLYGFITVRDERDQKTLAETGLREETARANRERKTAEAAAEFIESMFETLKPAVSKSAVIAPSELLVTWSRRLDEGYFDGRPEVEARVRNMLGRMLSQFNKKEQGLENLGRAVALRSELFGASDPSTLGALHNLGSASHTFGELKQAEAALRRAFEGRKERLGVKDLATLTSMVNLSSLLHDLERFDEADHMLRTAIAYLRESPGIDDPRTLMAIQNLGVYAKKRGRFTEAETHLREALRGQRRVLGFDHLDTLLTTQSLGSLLYNAGRSEEAEPLFESAVDGCTRVFGEGHSRTQSALNSLANLWFQQGRFDRAEQAFRKVLSVWASTLGEQNPDTILAMTNLASTLVEQDELDEGEKLIRRAVDLGRSVLGPDNSETLAAQTVLAQVLRKAGRSQDAEPLYRDSLRRQERLFGPDHPNTQTGLRGLIICLVDLERPEEAQELVRDFVRRCSDRLPENDTNLLQIQNDLGVLMYNRFGWTAEAEPLLRRALEGRRQVLGEQADPTLRSMNSLASLLHDAGKLEESEQVYRETLRLRRLKHGEHHRLTFVACHNLGHMLASAGRLEEAQVFSREAFLGATRYRQNSPATQRALVSNHVRILRRIIADLSGRLGEEHLETQRARARLATALRHSEIEESETIFRELLPALAQVGAEVDRAEVQVQFGALLLSRQRFEEAERELRAALETFDLHDDPPTEALAEATTLLGACLAERAADDPSLFPQAEELLGEGCRLAEGTTPYHRIEPLSRLLSLYETWQEVAPRFDLEERAAGVRALLGRESGKN